MHVIRHNGECMEIVEIQSSLTSIDSIDDAQCDPRIVQPQRASGSLVQDRI